ncbi:MAG TPA: choice-of-anchor D domain-containing protein [Acidobacteriaceae bacterium]|nr:choice-of-anchor D domain-containing protein [Acidobacteriaceae bacterium]
MRIQSFVPVAVCLALGIGSCVPAAAQIASESVQPAISVPSRVIDHVDDSRLVRLTGNTHPLARPANDKGLVEPSKLLERMVLVLQRSPEQEKALAAFNEGQYDPKSPDYHHWLHADEFGQLYGPSDSDISAVTSWLQNHGFSIDNVSKGHTSIEFTGTVAQVQDSFHVEMHNYLVSGEEHIANDRDPQIPAALAPVITGVASLNNFFPKPNFILGNVVRRDSKTGKVHAVAAPAGLVNKPESVSGNVGRAPGSAQGPQPQLTYSGNGDVYQDVTPYDFATIYNSLPLWISSTPITGKGVSVAIAADSDIEASDVTNFRKSFGLAAAFPNAPAFKVVHNGADPGVVQGASDENTLDVEMSGAAAPEAQIIEVVTADTSTTGGWLLSDQYIVDNEVASIMSASYGTCELFLGTAGNASYNTVWQQAATEGISAFESSGDQAAAGCYPYEDPQRGTPFAETIGLQVNGMASSPFVTAVGGTDFTWPFVDGAETKYWGAQQANGATALGYLPEVPWNSTCANPLLPPLFGQANTEDLCNYFINADGGFYDSLITIIGGSGGVSSCTHVSPVGSTTATACSVGYPKPSWQTGLGVPSQNNRFLPDVSLFSSDGIGPIVQLSAGQPASRLINSSAILFCLAASGGTCDYSDPAGIEAQEIGGTSAASPYFAGIMALVVQKTKAAQGLANPELYTLYKNQVAAGTSCNSSTVANGNKCAFYDISQGTISQACITGDPNCVTSTSGDEVGLLSGYPATVGYDPAIGLGSVNITNLVNAWPTTATTQTVTVSPTSLAFASTLVGSTTAAQTVTIKNTGTAVVTLTSETITGTDASSFLKSATTCGASLAASATCTVSIEFKPASAGSLTASLSIADNASGSPQLVSLAGTGTSGTAGFTFSPASLTFPATSLNATSAAQVLTITNTGSVAATVSSYVFSGTNASEFSISTKTCGTSLAASASCTISIVFKPTVAGAATAKLVATDSAAGSPQSVPLSGTGASQATFAFSPTSLTFPATSLNAASAAQVLTITNNGSVAASVSSYVFSGTNASEFSISTKTCGTSLAAGAHCTISIVFKPTVAGAATAKLVATDSASGSPQSVPLAGTGASQATFAFSPTSLAFPATSLNATSAAQVLTITNNGSVAATVSSYVFSGTNASEFSISTKTCGTSLAAGASCTISIVFKPTVAGAATAKLVATDSASGSPQSVALSGTGASQATISFSPASITFPTTKVGVASAAQVLTIKNTSAIAISVSSYVFSGTNASEFSISAKTCGTSLAADASCTISLVFKPTATGSASANLVATDSAAGSPQSVSLAGTGD